MARTALEIQQSIIATVNASDPSIEVDAGPIFDSSIVPISSELATDEALADSIDQLYSTSFIKTGTADQVAAYLTNFALAPGTGGFSNGVCVFASYTRLGPGEVTTVPVGALVANGDNSLVYTVTTQKQILGDNISAYYNITQGWYEILVPVQAVNAGSQYDLPAFRITNLLTGITGIDVVQNRLKITGGSDVESTESSFQRVENAFFGQNSGTINGVVKLVQNYSPELITSVAIVRSGEYNLFTRFVTSLALDVYIVGVLERIVTEENYTIPFLTNYITFLKGAVYRVDAVLVNGVTSTAWQLQNDTNTASQYSTNAQDKLVFPTLLLQPGDLVTVTYAYNGLLEDVTTNVFNSEQDNLFDMDILTRQMLNTAITLQGSVTVSSSATASAVITQVESLLFTLIETGVNGAVLQPEIVRQNLINQISGLSDFSWTKFTTTTGSLLNVEIINLPKNSIGKIDLSTLNIT